MPALRRLAALRLLSKGGVAGRIYRREDFRMKVILKNEVKDLGKRNDVKDVSDGYARNYLFPKGLALEATDSNMLRVKQENEKIERKKKKELNRIEKLMQRLGKASINISVKTGEDEKLFGVVTKEDIAAAISKETGIAMDKQDVMLEEPIKATGVYLVQVKIKLEGFPDEQAKATDVKIWVIGEK